MIEIKFAAVKDGAKIPSKRYEDAAYDIYACFDEDCLEIPPHQSRLIPTGIASAFDPEWRVLFYERGSTGVINMKTNAGVIDSGFRGEWFVSLYNGNDIPIIITKGIDKTFKGEYAILYPYTKGIAQALLDESPNAVVSEISYEALKQIASERGTGMIGSSGK